MSLWKLVPDTTNQSYEYFLIKKISSCWEWVS